MDPHGWQTQGPAKDEEQGDFLSIFVKIKGTRLLAEVVFAILAKLHSDEKAASFLLALVSCS